MPVRAAAEHCARLVDVTEAQEHLLASFKVNAPGVSGAMTSLRPRPMTAVRSPNPLPPDPIRPAQSSHQRLVASRKASSCFMHRNGVNASSFAYDRQA